MCHSAIAARIIDCFSSSTLTKAITSSSWHARISLLWTDLLNQQDINNITFTGLHYASWKVSHWLSQRCFSLSVELPSALKHASLELFPAVRKEKSIECYQVRLQISNVHQCTLLVYFHHIVPSCSSSIYIYISPVAGNGGGGSGGSAGHFDKPGRV